MSPAVSQVSQKAQARKKAREEATMRLRLVQACTCGCTSRSFRSCLLELLESHHVGSHGPGATGLWILNPWQTPVFSELTDMREAGGHGRQRCVSVPCRQTSFSYTFLCALRLLHFKKEKNKLNVCEHYVEHIYWHHFFFQQYLLTSCLCSYLDNSCAVSNFFMIIIFVMVFCDQWSLMLFFQKDYDSLQAQVMFSVFQQWSIFKSRYVHFFSH